RPTPAGRPGSPQDEDGASTVINQRPTDLHRTRIAQRRLKDREIYILFLGERGQLAVCRPHAENQIDVEAILLLYRYHPLQALSRLLFDRLVDRLQLLGPDLFHPSNRIFNRIHDVQPGAERFGQADGEEDRTVVRVVVSAV